KSLCTSDCSRPMSLLHRASRHSRSSPSITSHFVSATTLMLSLPPVLLMRDADKANLRFVPIQHKRALAEKERFMFESGAAKLIGVEAKQQPLASPGTEEKMASPKAINRHHRLNRG